jgi:elongation factor G
VLSITQRKQLPHVTKNVILYNYRVKENCAMKVYDAHHIRNICLMGHAGSGKTTLAEAMLFESKEITRRGSVEEKSTASDYHDIEHERGSSVLGTVLFAEWKDYKINIIDTPGYDDYVGEVISALRVVDTAPSWC